MSIRLSRRNFLQTAAAVGSGLLLKFDLSAATASEPLKLNAFVHVGTDDLVTLYIHKAEMGQGTVTSLSMLLAEELECDWTKIRTRFPGVNREYGPNQGVVGSASIRTSWETLRRAGATAREMLIQAAAQQWGVDGSTLRAENNAVVNTANNARLTYGALADAASKLTPPANITLKDPKDWKLIGKPTKRLDTASKVNGSATFGIDVRRPNMLFAVVARCPVFGGKAAAFDASKCSLIPGVKRVVQISTGVAVLADNTWSAHEGKRALNIMWQEGPHAGLHSGAITQMFASKMDQPGDIARKAGDGAAALDKAAKQVEAVYQVPYLAHAPMEPLNCTADVRADSCEVWASTQGQTAALNEAVRVTGLKPEQVQIHTEYMGGGFGRRARSDYIGEAVEISKAAGVPVRLTWTREDDTQHDWYRPASYARMIGGLDADGWPTVWTARIACTPFGGGSRTSVEGVADIAYAIPHLQVEHHAVDPGIPVSYWRSVGYSQNTYFAESFLDELAAAGGKDPLEVRRRLLANSPRMLAALELAAEKAGWGKPLPAGHGRGIALSNNIGSNTVQIAEVSVDRGRLKVHRVVCAVDCGHVVNPAGVEQQIKSGIAFGLSALKGGIVIGQGRVQQGNFNNYDVVRIDEMPSVEVHLIASQANPGGIGEASTPSSVPAVLNAAFAATGKRIRRLPLQPGDLV